MDLPMVPNLEVKPSHEMHSKIMVWTGNVDGTAKGAINAKEKSDEARVKRLLGSTLGYH